jgi:hypothetical protein
MSTSWKHIFNNNINQPHKKAKGKVVPVHTINAYRGSRGVAPLSLNLGARWRTVVSITPRTPYSRGKNAATHWIGGCVGTRDSLDDLDYRNISSLVQFITSNLVLLAHIIPVLYKIKCVRTVWKWDSYWKKRRVLQPIILTKSYIDIYYQKALLIYKRSSTIYSQ